MVRSVFCLATLGLALTFLGCSPAPDNVALVSGVVTLDSQPLPDATVHFQSSSDSNAMYVARTDKDGRFQLMHARDVEGAVLGHYRVRISTFAPANPDAVPPLPEVPERVPSTYLGEDSTLSADVAQGENDLRFDLVSP